MLESLFNKVADPKAQKVLRTHTLKNICDRLLKLRFCARIKRRHSEAKTLFYKW